MQKWEYLYIWLERDKPRFTTEWTGFETTIGGKKYSFKEFAQYMQTLGEQGWELVSTTPIAYPSSDNWRGMTTELVYTFKRPKA